MKTKFLITILSLSAFLGLACSPQNQNTGANSQPGANLSQMNHQSMENAPMNHDGMMNHSEMKSSPNAAAAPYDLQFLDTMTAHHQGAVDMAKPAADKAEHSELKTLAKNIIADQEKEITQMRGWREKWFGDKPPAVNMEMAGMSDSMKGMDMKILESANGNSYDLEFIKQMTPHHEGAVVMAREALQKAEHAEIKTLASGIIKAQEAEIKQMKDWQTAWNR